MLLALSSSESYLYSLPRFALVGRDAYKPGLDRMVQLLGNMGNPQLAFRSIHVAGTNGKGSTASFIAAIASAAGRKTGLHTSPHLLHVGERMRIDGIQAPAAWIDAAVQRRQDLFRDTGASFFEATTALSFEYFAEYNVDLAVVEVGLGGRYDATNVLHPEVSVITGVALDHEELLGSTVELIAAEKAGIVKPGVPVVTAATKPGVVGVIRAAAEQCRSDFHSIDEEVVTIRESENRITIRTPIQTYSNLTVDLAGSHQIRNAALAVRAVELCSHLVGAGMGAVRAGLAETRSLSGLHGRLERLFGQPDFLRESHGYDGPDRRADPGLRRHADPGLRRHAAPGITRHPDIFVDVAHNADAIMASIETCELLSGRLDHVFIGLMEDKQVDSIGDYLAERDVRISTLYVDSERAMDPSALAERLCARGARMEREPMTVSEALDRFVTEAYARETLLFLGSHLVVADAMRWAAVRASATDTQRLQ